MPEGMTFVPLVPLWMIAALGLIAAPLVTLYLFHHAHGGILRALLFALVALVLANPVLREEDREPLSDIAVVVIDESTSQNLDARAERVARTRKKLEAELARIDNLDVRWVSFTQGSGGARHGTRLFGALSKALIDVPPNRLSGVVLITDGQVHDVPRSLSELGFDAPVHALLTGREGEGDRKIVLEQAPRYGIVGQQQFISLRVEDSGARAGEKGEREAKVSVNIDGEVSRTYDVPVGRNVNIPLTIEHGGATVVELTANDGPAELTRINNRAIVTTEGVRERLRVLLVSGEPHAGERTWRNLLKADAAVDLVHFTILRPPEKQDGTPIRELSLIAFPTRELFSVKLEEFDLIIFDRYQRRGVLPLIYLANVVDYVEKGGAVLAAAGPAFATPISLYRTPLSVVLPASPTGAVIEQPYRPKITTRGRRHPVTRGLDGANTGADGEPDWGHWLRLIDVDVASGDTVMSGVKDKPLVVLSRNGKGRVAQLLSDHSWLWSRGFDGGGPQAELLRRLAHWLMKEPELEEEALIGRHDGARLTIERRTMADKARAVFVTAPSGKVSQVELTEAEPGVWRAGMAHSGMGLYQLQDGKLNAVVAVGAADPLELRDVEASAEKLQPVLSQSGGGAYWLVGADANGEALNMPRLQMVSAGRRASGESWFGLRRNEAYTIKSIEERPLTAGLVCLMVLLSLLGLTWYREGR